MKAPFPACSRELPYTFVSYAHADTETVFDDIVLLHEAGGELWYDEGIEPGSSWREELGTAIEECQTFLFFLSQRSLGSRHCRQELDFALETNRPILVVHLESVDLSAGLRLSLNDRQALLRYNMARTDYRRKLSSTLESLAINGADGVDQPSVQGSRTTPSAFRKPVWLLSVAVVLLGLLGIVGFWFVQQNVETASPSTVPEIQSVAVLPLENRSTNAQSAYLGVGIAEELLSALHSLESVRVANRNDTFRQSASNSSLVEIGKALRVQGVLFGSIQETGDIIKVSVTLANADDGFELWTEIIEGDLSDPFRLQSDVSARISARFSPREDATVVAAELDFGTDDPQAYRLGQQGLQLSRQPGNPKALGEAQQLLESALQLDPQYYELYPRLMAVIFTLSMHEQRDGERDAAAVIARAADAGAPSEITLVMDRLQAEGRGDLFHVERIERELMTQQGQIEWNPLTGFSGPMIRYGLLLAVAGFYADAEQYWRTLLPMAISLDQQDGMRMQLLMLTVLAGRFDEAIDDLNHCAPQASVFLGTSDACVAMLVRLQLAAGRLDAARATVQDQPEHAFQGYLRALVDQDKQALQKALDATPAEIFFPHYIVLNDNEQFADAAVFWRQRFPIGGVKFLWDTIILAAAQNPQLAGRVEYRDLLEYYGITPAWRKHLCEGAHKLAPHSGITPQCL